MKRERVAFLDWLRLAAAVSMIQGHTIDATLADPFRRGVAFEVWTWTRGLTAPVFLIASGVSFYLAVRLDDEDAYRRARSGSAARRRRVVRATWLIVLGTAMHAGDGRFVVDILQCVGATLLALEMIVACSARPRDVLAAAALLAAIVVAFALPATTVAWSAASFGWLGAWLDDRGGSLFPLLPWSAYLFAGVVAGRFVLAEGARSEPRRVLVRWFCVALAACLGALVVRATFDAPSPPSWSSHPRTVLERFALVAALASIATVVGARVRLPRWLAALSAETLALYVVHLAILYAPVAGLARVAHRVLEPAGAMGLALVVLATSAILAWSWGRLWPGIEGRWFPWLRREPTDARIDERRTRHEATECATVRARMDST